MRLAVDTQDVATRRNAVLSINDGQWLEGALRDEVLLGDEGGEVRD